MSLKYLQTKISEKENSEILERVFQYVVCYGKISKASGIQLKFQTIGYSLITNREIFYAWSYNGANYLYDILNSKYISSVSLVPLDLIKKAMENKRIKVIKQ